MNKQYRYFFMKIGVFVFAFVLLDFLVGVIFGQLRNKAYNDNPFSREQEFVCHYCIDVATPDMAIIGSSKANHHYIPSVMEDSLGLSAYNFGIDGGFLLFQSTLINLMLERHAPSYIIWEVGETSLSSLLSKDKEYQSMSLLYPWYSNSVVKYNINKKDSWQRARMLSSSYRNNSKLIMLLKTFLSSEDKEELKVLKGYYPLFDEGSYPKMIESHNDDYVIDQEKEKMLLETISRCKEKGVTLIFASSPNYVTDRIKSTSYYIRLREIANQYNIPFLDFYNIEPFCSDSTLFKDNTHLNDNGAQLYMTMFIPVLKQIVLERGI